MQPRDHRGRFLERRTRQYLLRFSHAEPERVYARTPSEAVAVRETPEQPHTISDLTALDAWAKGGTPRGTPHMSLVPRVETWDEAGSMPMSTFLERVSAHSRLPSRVRATAGGE